MIGCGRMTAGNRGEQQEEEVPYTGTTRENGLRDRGQAASGAARRSSV